MVGEGEIFLRGAVAPLRAYSPYSGVRGREYTEEIDFDAAGAVGGAYLTDKPWMIRGRQGGKR